MANSYPRYLNNAQYEDPASCRYQPAQQQQQRQQLKQETPPEDWGYAQQQQSFKQETPPHDWVGYDDLGLANPQFPSSATTMSAGSPQWGNNYVATGQQSYPPTTGYEVDVSVRLVFDGPVLIVRRPTWCMRDCTDSRGGTRGSRSTRRKSRLPMAGYSRKCMAGRCTIRWVLRLVGELR